MGVSRLNERAQKRILQTNLEIPAVFKILILSFQSFAFLSDGLILCWTVKLNYFLKSQVDILFILVLLLYGKVIKQTWVKCFPLFKIYNYKNFVFHFSWQLNNNNTPLKAFTFERTVLKFWCLFHIPLHLKEHCILT